jgi:hypothetical protein
MFVLLASRRPILLRSRSKFLGLIACFFTVSADTLDCDVLNSEVRLRAALWEQSYKNYQNRALKLKKCGKNWLLNVSFLVSKNVIFLFIEGNSIM